MRGGPDPGDRERLYLHAGELAIGARPTAITTVLGSCVAVCLYDAGARVGGVNHFLHAHPLTGDASPRFGAVAVPALVDAVLAAGARRAFLEAKVFGGASVASPGGRRTPGAENAALALQLLEAAGIPVVQSDLGGQRGRTLVFHSDDGSAWVRPL